MKKNQNWSK